ncbi:response regulator [Marinicauda pacifica]|uniref:Response regulator n=1 Tax=Marinicauda pacifica TaxID=1133559 RepID=A0A4S2HBD9_9PROT|nr:response regulator [Marinicauda pacifica]TGY92988.1 response regulator [Marinicauda pacifica]GGE41910.1 response regulator [Marinicauda pacifica]
MPFSTAIRPHIPYLRRYARILTGSQESGDAYVRAALEAAIEGAEEIDRDLPPNVALYQLFHATWKTSGARLDRPGGDGEKRQLGELPPEARQMLLLTAVENFSVDQAATILRIDVGSAKSNLIEAQTYLENGMATEVLIIEDEPIIALDLQSIVERMGHKVVGVARTRDEAVRLANEHSPRLVLADIQLADNSSGIDAAHDILKDHRVPVIFITAYPERLLTGEKPEPTYLITKPFMPETVAATISQALFFAGDEERAEVAE